MESWKRALYAAYVSTGQARPPDAVARPPRPGDYPYLVRLIARHVPGDRDLAIADLGCGHGALVACLRAAGYRRVEGVDVSGEQVALARALGVPGISEGDLLEFLADRRGAFDVLFLMDVLEHLTRQEIFDLLAAARNALRDGGRLIIHAPNGAGLHGMRILYGDFTHETCLTPQSARQILHANGFTDVRVHEDTPTLHSPKGVIRAILWRVLTAPRRLLLYAETGVAHHVLSQNLLVTARRSGGSAPG